MTGEPRLGRATKIMPYWIFSTKDDADIDQISREIRALDGSFDPDLNMVGLCDDPNAFVTSAQGPELAAWLGQATGRPVPPFRALPTKHQAALLELAAAVQGTLAFPEISEEDQTRLHALAQEIV